MRAHRTRVHHAARPHHQCQRRRRHHRVRRQGVDPRRRPVSAFISGDGQRGPVRDGLHRAARDGAERPGADGAAARRDAVARQLLRLRPAHATARRGVGGPPHRRDGAGAARRAAQPLGPVGRQPARRRDAPPPRGHGEVPARVGRARRRRRPPARADHRQLVGRGRVGRDAALGRREAVEGRLRQADGAPPRRLRGPRARRPAPPRRRRAAELGGPLGRHAAGRRQREEALRGDRAADRRRRRAGQAAADAHPVDRADHKPRRGAPPPPPLSPHARAAPCLHLASTPPPPAAHTAFAPLYRRR